jgi:hypothetical protein
MINLDLSFQPPLIFFSTYADLQSFDPLSLARINLNDQSNVLLSDAYIRTYQKSQNNLIGLLYLSPSLFESRDEIPVKWGRIVTPQNLWFWVVDRKH